MRKEANLQEWQELYDLTLEIKKREPWKILWDTDILRIILQGETEPNFICTLGRNESTYGIVVYSGYESFNSYVELSGSNVTGIPAEYLMYEQDNLTCYFGNRNEVSKEQYKVISELGLSFRGKNQWPYFLSFKPLFSPYLPDSNEVQKLIKVYRELIPLIEAIASKTITVNFSNNETVTRYYDQKIKDWQYDKGQLMIKEKRFATLNLDALHPIVKQIKTLPCNNTSIEIDMNYINTTISGKEDGFERPLNPKFLVLINQDTGMIINQTMITPKEKEAETIAQILLDYIEKYNRPKAIYFKLPVIGFLFKNFCPNIDVKLIQSKKLRLSEEYFQEFSKFMCR